MRTNNKRILTLLILLFFSFHLSLHTYAAETKSDTNTEPVICDFVMDRQQILELHVSPKQMQNENWLLKQMPKTITVLYNTGEIREQHVTWKNIEGNIEGSYYLQYSPVFPDGCLVDPGIDIYKDGPYVAVEINETTDTNPVSISGYSMENTEDLEDPVYQYLTNVFGFNNAVACGIMANIQAESDFRSNNLQGSFEQKTGYTDETYTAAVDDGTYTEFSTDKAGYGLCQWTYSTRKEGLYQLKQERKVSISDYQMQLDFMNKEITSKMRTYLNEISDTEDGAYDAGYYWCLEFERPAAGETSAVKRGNLAKTYYNDYKNEFQPGNYIVTASALTVRSEPTTDSEALTYVHENDVFSVSEVRKFWGKIEINGKTGWISLYYCDAYKGPIIQKQPVSTVVEYSGDAAELSIEAIGKDLTYEWYYKNAGASSFTKSSVTSTTYRTTVTAARQNREIYCKITDAFGNQTKSNTITVSYEKRKLEITRQPKSMTANIGDTLSISISASGDGLSYAWYYRNKGATEYKQSECVRTTYKTLLTKARDGREIFCIVTDQYGNRLQSDVITVSAK